MIVEYSTTNGPLNTLEFAYADDALAFIKRVRSLGGIAHEKGFA
jgi:hypothetical protein